MIKPVLISCPCCRGTGRVNLTGVYAETLRLLRRQRRPLNGAALARLAGIAPTAMNNRLVRLEKVGLASATPYGRQRLWTASTPRSLPC